MRISHIEEAVDEIARLDQVASAAPFAAGDLLRLVAVSRSAPVPGPHLHRLLAAEVDPFHEDALDPALRGWRDLVAEEDRRARGGAFPSMDRIASVAPALATYSSRARLEATWREAPAGTAALTRALDAAAWAPDHISGNLLAGLMLVLGGRMDQLRCLPFRDLSSDDWTSATAAWRAGEEGPWANVALTSAARESRRLRERLVHIAEASVTEGEALDGLGRAAITARRALAQLHRAVATTMPILAEDLGVSRPAAADALARLEACGLARELTGRARDRVWSYAPGLTLGDV